MSSVFFFWGNNIGPEGCFHLTNALKINCTLKILELEFNHINDDCCTYFENFLQENSKTSLEILHLGSNHITEQGELTLNNLEREYNINIIL